MSKLHNDRAKSGLTSRLINYLPFSGRAFTEVLNDTDASAVGVQDLPAQLLQMMRTLRSEAFDALTNKVDYAAIANSERFQEYLRLAAGLRSYDLRQLETDNSRRSFWINLYNALIIHSVVAYKPRRSINEHGDAFERAAYLVGDVRYSANDIEHGILRVNAGHPLSLRSRFRKSDPRYRFIIGSFDVRIHFALNCAAQSCPPINFYAASNVDVQLDLAARNFINNGGLVIRPEDNTLYLSRIFSWYAADFDAAWFGYRKQTYLAKFATQYLESETDRLFLAQNLNSLKVRFLPYDWSLNVRR